MAKAKPQERTRTPEICNGCIDGMDLPPRTVMVKGKSQMRHYFICTAFTSHQRTNRVGTKENKCAGKRLIPFAELAKT